MRDAWATYLESVVDAAGVDQYPLLGISQGCAVSIAYAVRHPRRVSHLVLYGGFALGAKKRSPGEKEQRNALTTLIRQGWGLDNPGIPSNIYGAVHAWSDTRAGRSLH